MSRFVSAGTDADYQPPVADDGWLKAQQEVESSRKPKKVEEQEGAKSLYEVLQANKAAKQEAFEESARLKNQFRALDEDEVDFLDSVLESSRAKEDAVKQETAEQLDAFRKQRTAAEQALIAGNSDTTAVSPIDGGPWAMKKRKRRRDEHEASGNGKLRKLSTADDGQPAAIPSDASPAAETEPLSREKDSNEKIAPTKIILSQNTVNLGLAAYSSDEDE